MHYLVTVRTADKQLSYPAVGDIQKITEAAFDHFDVCAVTVMVQA